MKKLITILFIAIGVISCSDNSSQKEQVFAGDALGTTYHIKFYSQKEFNFQQTLDSIFKEINSSMSTYQEDSDISKINRGAKIKVDSNFIKVFTGSKKIFKESEGFFDPTVGGLVNAYGFGPGKSLEQINSLQTDSLMDFVGLDKVQLAEDGTITKTKPEVFLDFNAIAKGFTVDVIANDLEAKGVENYLIELGGELRAAGKNKKNGKHWLVGIDDPFQTKDDARRFKSILKLEDGALATSGNYRKFRTDSVSGERFVHTVNPLTGKAEKSNLLSASVMAKNCMLADAYATTFMAMGYERSLKLIKKLDSVDVYFIYSKKDGSTGIFSSEKFVEALAD